MLGIATANSYDTAEAIVGWRQNNNIKASTTETLVTPKPLPEVKLVTPAFIDLPLPVVIAHVHCRGIR